MSTKTDETIGRRDANTDHDIHDLFRRRWSPRAFTGKSLSQRELQSILEAGRWSASCNNDQPWYFLVARRDEPERFEEMLGCINPSNQLWAGKAGALVVAVARLTFTRDGQENPVALYDLGQAAAHMALQATALGLQAHPMRGFDRAKARQVYGVPDGYDVVTAIAIGAVAGPESLPDNLRQRELAPRQRRKLAEFTFSGKWGKPAF